jgi:putative methyltransferase (TIGR04325 family)
MALIPTFIRKILQPLLLETNKKSEIRNLPERGWSRAYGSWSTALADSSKYESEKILLQVKEALLKVKRGEAVYERDGVIFDEVQYSWPLSACLSKVALERGGKLNVMDFGGSLGSSYFQNMGFLNLGENLQWNVIEQKHFVTCGLQYFQDESLNFYYDIDSYLKVSTPDVIIVSGVLQYLKDPYELIHRLLKIGCKYIFVDRTAFVNSTEDVIRIQSSDIDISYPAWFFEKAKFIAAFAEYEMFGHFEDITTPSLIIDGDLCYWAGFMFRRIKNN